jgi:hypothetical protein
LKKRNRSHEFLLRPPTAGGVHLGQSYRIVTYRKFRDWSAQDGGARVAYSSLRLLGALGACPFNVLAFLVSLGHLLG